MSSDNSTKIVGTPSGPRAKQPLLMQFDASYFANQEGSGEVFFVKDDSTVGDAFHLLSEKKILSLPVRRSSGHREFFAFIDMLDILSFFLKTYGEHFADEPDWGTSSGDLEQFAAKRGQFLDTPVLEICNLSGRNRWFAVQADAPLRVVLDLFAVHGVHRVPIVSATGDLITLVTQSRMVRFLADHSDLLREHFPRESLAHLQLGFRPVLTVKASDLALAAFKLIQQESVSGVGVVSDSGALVGNISASDLRLIHHANLLMGKLFLTCEDFLREISLCRADAKIPDGPLTIVPTMTLEEVFVKFAETSVHRLYITDPEGGALLGLLTLGNILAALLI